jgi:radical SAM protein with 4Fe4S-binding SPASM domain
MDFDFFCRIAEEMRSNGVCELGLFYLGESTLYKKLADAIRFAKTTGFPYVFLTTNGRNANEDLIRDCAAAGLDSLKFSLNAGSRDQYSKSCGVDAFDVVVENIVSARRALDCVKDITGHSCGLYVSSIYYDDNEPSRMEEVLDKLRPYIDEHYWLPLYGQAGLTVGARGTMPTAGNRGRLGALRDALPCWALFTEGHVTWDGKLTGCCFDHNDSFTFGNLNEMSFAEAWHSDSARLLRRANLDQNVSGTACEKCIAYA